MRSTSETRRASLQSRRRWILDRSANARPPANRVGARCHAFSRLTVAFLRAAGVPARARCGFGDVFPTGMVRGSLGGGVLERRADDRWRMADAQLDAVWRKKIDFTGDALSITRDGVRDGRTCVAGLAARRPRRQPLWVVGDQRARRVLDRGQLAPRPRITEQGRDAPVGCLGSGWEPGEEPTAAQLDLFDTVAELTDERGGELAPVGAGRVVVGADHLDAHVVGAGVAHRLHARRDRVEVAPRDDRVDQAVAARVGEVVVAVAEPAQVVRVVRQRRRRSRCAGARSRARSTGSVSSTTASSTAIIASGPSVSRATRDVLGRDEVRVRARGAVARELQHARAERGQHARTSAGNGTSAASSPSRYSTIFVYGFV